MAICMKWNGAMDEWFNLTRNRTTIYVLKLQDI